MPRIKLRTREKKLYERISRVSAQTEIIQRQKRLTYGRWDFVVFGAAGKKETILRVGYAEQTSIHRAPVYIASLTGPGLTEVGGVPIEEFISEDVPEEYRGLEIIQVDPLRPLTIDQKRTLPSIGQAADEICREYEDQNIAVIHSPGAMDWMISVMKYLHECDQAFPDRVQEAFQTRLQSQRGHMFTFPGSESSSKILN